MVGTSNQSVPESWPLNTDEIPGDRRGQYKLFEYYGDPEAAGRAKGVVSPQFFGILGRDLWTYGFITCFLVY